MTEVCIILPTQLKHITVMMLYKQPPSVIQHILVKLLNESQPALCCSQVLCCHCKYGMKNTRRLKERA